MEMLRKILQENGFTDKEATLYITLLEMGEATVGQLSVRAHLKRTTIYSVLEEMKHSGIVSVSKRRGIIYLSPLPPRILVDRFRRASRLAEEALPDLMALAYASPLKPRMRVLEGIEGIKNVLLEFGNSSEPTKGFTDYDGMPKDLLTFMRTDVIPLRRKQGIIAQLLIPNNVINQKVKTYDNSRFSEHRLIDFGAESGLLELLIYGKSNVAFLSFAHHEQFAIVLDSHAAHRMLTGIFDVLWQQTA